MIAAPTARSGQTAPNSHAECRLSRTAGGREPCGAQTWVIVPCWPTRLISFGAQPSWNQASRVRPRNWHRGLRLRVAMRVAFTPLLPCSICEDRGWNAPVAPCLFPCVASGSTPSHWAQKRTSGDVWERAGTRPRAGSDARRHLVARLHQATFDWGRDLVRCAPRSCSGCRGWDLWGRHALRRDRSRASAIFAFTVSCWCGTVGRGADTAIPFPPPTPGCGAPVQTKVMLVPLWWSLAIAKLPRL